MLPTGNRTGITKMMSIATGRLVTRDQFKTLPMPSTVIARLNDMAAKEGRKIVTRTSMVYNPEGGLRNPGGVTYIRPTAEPYTGDSVDPAIPIEGFTVGEPADNIGTTVDNVEHTREMYSAEEIENDIREMDVQNGSETVPLGYMQYNE